MNSIDLFCGCGGLTLGFEMAGFNSILASDIDENCGRTIKRNFPGVEFLQGDISQFSRTDFEAIVNGREIDVVTGGPPCQGFSLANKNRNKVENDPRNRLFYEFVKVLGWFEPKAFVMENVKGLLSMDKGKVLETILTELRNAGSGYCVEYRVLRASDYGVPQNRERVIFIGFRRDLGITPEFPNPSNESVSLDDAIMDLPQIESGEGVDCAKYNVPPQNTYQELMREGNQFVHNHIAMRHTKRIVERHEINPRNR